MASVGADVVEACGGLNAATGGGGPPSRWTGNVMATAAAPAVGVTDDVAAAPAERSRRTVIWSGIVTVIVPGETPVTIGRTLSGAPATRPWSEGVSPTSADGLSMPPVSCIPPGLVAPCSGFAIGGARKVLVSMTGRLGFMSVSETRGSRAAGSPRIM